LGKKGIPDDVTQRSDENLLAGTGTRRVWKKKPRVFRDVEKYLRGSGPRPEGLRAGERKRKKSQKQAEMKTYRQKTGKRGT